jgi:hypothetical protein
MIPLFEIMYYFYLNTKLKSIRYDLQSGIKCYCCKKEIELSDEELYDKYMGRDKGLKLCKSCNRNVKINKLFNVKYIWIDKIKRFLLNDNFEKINVFIIMFFIIFFIIGIVLKIMFKVYWVFDLYNISFILYYIMIIYKLKIESIKKTSE